MSKKVCKLFALLLTFVLLFSVLGACAQDPTPDPPDTPPANGDVDTPDPTDDENGEAGEAGEVGEVEIPSAFQQAPMLDGLDLPPVDERLPVNPLVIEPWDTIGTYGGTWRKSVTIGTRAHGLAAIGFYEGHGLIVWCMEMRDVVPNLAESMEMSADGTTVTFTLREGLRWSDGHPMTTADVLFWFEARESHPEVNPGWEAATIRIDRVEVIDETTFSFVYNTANPLAFYELARFNWNSQFLPKHYMSQFHPDFDDGAEQRAEDEGFDSWIGLFGDRANWQVNPDLPTMAPFVLTTDGGDAAATLIYERNPFFWAVDPAGNQLPYIDQVIVDIVESEDIALMRAAAGEIDLQMATITESFLNFPFLAENADSGGYEVRTYEYAEPNVLGIYVNMAHGNPYLREVFRAVEFRQALAYALNRDLIIATLLTVGPVSSTPRNFSPFPGSPFYDPEWSYAFTTHDLDRANQLLDDMGLDERNAAGTRLLPNGEPLQIVIDVPLFVTLWLDLGIMVADQLQEVGIDAVANGLEPALWNERLNSSEFDITAMGSTGGFASMNINEINIYTGFRNLDWTTAFQQGLIVNRQALAAGEDVEPMDVPADIQRLWELGAAIVVEVDEAARLEMLNEVFQLHKDNLYILGIGTRLPGIYVVSNRMSNVPPLLGDWNFGVGGTGRPSHFFFID